MKGGGLTPWIADAICESSKTSWQMGRTPRIAHEQTNAHTATRARERAVCAFVGLGVLMCGVLSVAAVVTRR